MVVILGTVTGVAFIVGAIYNAFYDKEEIKSIQNPENRSRVGKFCDVCEEKIGRQGFNLIKVLIAGLIIGGGLEVTDKYLEIFNELRFHRFKDWINFKKKV